MKLNRRAEVGRVGEDTACKYLIGKGFSIIERNYWKKWGEIDILAKRSKKLHFVEVKTVSCENVENKVIHETDTFRPEDNIHPWKIKRLSRVIQTYLLEKGNEEQEWQFDVVTVLLDLENKVAKVKLIEDIIL